MKLVCPHELVDRLEGRTLCVRVGTAGDIAGAGADARQRNTLHCVICETSATLEEIEVEDAWNGVPIALMTPSAGRVRNIARKLDALRKQNLRVYLPGEALTDARLLASLGIDVCIGFGADWDALADLMTYALIGLAAHGRVDPFETIADGYRRPARAEDWGRVFFDDPSRYLHLDARGRIALTRRELEGGTFVADDVSKLDTPELKSAVAERSEAWRALFAEDHFCARCNAWRICRGRMRDGKAAPDGCAAFFCEMAEVIERRRTGRQAATWQP